MSRAVDDRIRGLATRQHGVVSRSQLLNVGISSGAIGRRLESGALRCTHLGVYTVGPVESPGTAPMAAVLAGGPAAVLSHTNALHLWRMSEAGQRRPIHVTVPGSGRGRRAGIRFHRVARLEDDERDAIDGIPVTSPARTLVDVAAMLGSKELEHAVATAERKGLLTRAELSKLPQRYRRRRGMSVLRILFQQDAGPAFVRSEAERQCLRMLAAAGLPRPHANVPVGPYELDLFWPDEGIAIEIDGRSYHSRPARFEGDRRKDRWLRARGIQVVRLTWNQITRHPMPTAVEVGQILALTRAERTRSGGRHPPPMS